MLISHVADNNATVYHVIQNSQSGGRGENVGSAVLATLKTLKCFDRETSAVSKMNLEENVSVCSENKLKPR